MARAKSTASGNTSAPSDSVGEGNKAEAKVGAAKVSGIERTVAINTIKVRPGWNPRQYFDPAEIAGLAQSIKDLGQLASLVVCEGDKGAFWLVAGEKRLRALTLGGFDSARVIVIRESDAMAAMWAENFRRSGISHADRCKWYADRLAAGASIKELAAITGASESAISNDAGIAKGLHPDIWAEWSRMPGHSRIALQLYAKPHEVQLARWREYLAALETKGSARKASGQTGEGESEDKGDKGKPSRKELDACFAELGRMHDYCDGRESYGSAAHFLAGAKWAMLYMAGKATDPSDGMPFYPAHIAAVRAAMHGAENRQESLFKPSTSGASPTDTKGKGKPATTKAAG